MPRALLCASLLLLAASCGHGRLVPGPKAKLVDGSVDAAVAVDRGVRVVATLSDWRGLGEKLPDDLTPIKIRVVNHGARPVDILYESFTLKGHGGRRYRAVPALPLSHGDVLARMGPIRPIFAASNFVVATRFHDVYPHLEPAPAPLPRDEGLYRKAYGLWNGSPPGRELCRMALPEGVLAPGGEITGYVYFQSPIDDESKVILEAELVSGPDADPAASVTIPLRVD